MTAYNNSSTSPTDFLEYMASFRNLQEAVVIDSDSSDEVKIVSEHKATNHRCDLCCEGEFLVDKLLRFGGLIDKKYRFVCDKCDKNFVHKSECNKHATNCTGPVYDKGPVYGKSEVISHATKQTSNTFKCETCSKTFKSPGGRTKHIKSQHSGLTHTCEICKKVFTNFKQFRYHHLKHCFDRPHYVCKFCDKRFNTEASLNKHYMNIHNIGKVVFGES